MGCLDELLSQNQAHQASHRRRHEMNIGTILTIAIGVLEVVKSHMDD